MTTTENPNERLLSVLTAMSFSGFEFHLTGSRYFVEDPHSSSDWDFFVQDSDGIESWLIDHGFKKAASYFGITAENNQEVLAVYQLPDDPWWADSWTSLYERERRAHHMIDVQIVLNADKKARIQESLAKVYRDGTPPPPSAWELAYALTA